MMSMTLGFLTEINTAHASLDALEEQESSSNNTQEQGLQETPTHSPNYSDRAYLFIHDTSRNMRRKKRIPLIQTSIRTVLDYLPENSTTGLRAFGHRFSLDGPDACTDTDIMVPMDILGENREDFEDQLNLLYNPPLGGGAPVGLALREGFSDLQSIEGHKEIFLYMVDLQKCPKENSIEAIRSACQVDDLHLTVIGIGLKQDFKTLQRANIEQLGCVDVLNILTPEEADELPDKLLTRLSVEFRNAEGELVDPKPGENLILELSRNNDEGKTETVRKKIKDFTVNGTSIDTVGLDEGTYFLELSYEGQKLRTQKEILVTKRDEIHEVVQLGKMLIDVLDTEGKQIEESVAKDVKITLLDSGKVIRTLDSVSHAEFDLLPGNQYNVLVSYNVGGTIQTVEYENPVTIREGNHKNIAVPLPIGSISGKILDMDASPSQSVKMKLTHTDETTTDTTFEKVAITDEKGQYFFPDIKNGTYKLSFEKEGYKSEYQNITVLGGKINTIGDIRLFHGIEIRVTGVSGTDIDDAEVILTHKTSSTQIPMVRHHQTYRNVKDISPGEYVVTVQKTGYQPASHEVVLKKDEPSIEVPFDLPYYITVRGNILNGKKEVVPDAHVTFQNINSSLILSAPQEELEVNTDGSFQAKLLVSGQGNERTEIYWRDIYNQKYIKDITFPLPATPQEVNLGKIHLPINFLYLTLHDVLGNQISADTVAVYHHQSGQSGIQTNLTEKGTYESTALLDGDYTVKIIKKGYQEIEHDVTITGGEIKRVPITLYNYITVTGTVTDGKNDRIPDALIEFQGTNSSLTSLQPIVTGKDGRFQATLLVEQAKKEQVNVSWKSPKSGKEYQFSTVFNLPGTPITEFYPMDLGTYRLPANFVRVEVQDASRRGLTGVDVQFISNRGKITSGIELGDGLYESLDLHDGYYNISITKPGYKENILISDIAVGKSQREVNAGPVILPHYATLTGTVLNGNDEGMPNVEIFFGKESSEQLERCRTDQDGRFSTTLLITGANDENWQAVWKREEFSVSGKVTLPLNPNDSVNIGEIHLPANFVSIPVNDVQGKILSDVSIDVVHKDGSQIDLEEFKLEETEPGVYQARNLPNGDYTFSFQKEGYEIGKHVDVTVQGGNHYALKPVQLGYYVTVTGKAVNGRQEPVANATITFKELFCTVLPPEPQLPLEETPPQEEPESIVKTAGAKSRPAITTDSNGIFSAKVLVTSPGIERLTATWKGKYSSSYTVNLSGGPSTQNLDLKLPINFIGVNVADISGTPLSKVSVTLTHQIEKTIFPLQEANKGTYVSEDLPDGSYTVFIQKPQYANLKGTMTVQNGEIQHADFRLNHYVTVKGYVVDGKEEGISAATVTFQNLKTDSSQKIISGTDGAFETQLLVKELGRESGQITWFGKHGTYTKQFWLDVPSEPSQITLARKETKLPINYITIEVKSVAATGVAGANVKLTHQETGQIIEARDNDNGNYEGIELPNGYYDIQITKDKYQPITLEHVAVANGEHKRDLLIPKFSHYITMSGVILNGKNQGVPNAVVMIKEPQRLENFESFTTREDGSFTLHALVTDVGSEILEITWNDIYTTSLPVKLPSTPEHVRLENIKLPINFISVNVQDIYGKNIPEATVVFVEKHQEMTIEEQKRFQEQGASVYQGKEVSRGIYESPALPDNRYLIIVRKEGYVQKTYPEVSVESGTTISDVTLNLPHLITIAGNVTNGKGEGIPGVKVDFTEKNSQRNTYQLETDESGYFSEQLLVTSPGRETLILSKQGEAERARDLFKLSQEFTLLAYPGKQKFDELRMPINFIPIRVQDVAERGVDDANVILTSVNTSREQDGTNQILPKQTEFIHAINLGNGRYEGHNLKDGTYTISIRKEGHEPQERMINVMSGEVASEAVFILPHYVIVKGMITEGKGNGLSNATLEFDTQNSEIVSLDLVGSPYRGTKSSLLQNQPVEITTNPNGQFIAKLLVKQAGIQRVRAVWHDTFVKQFFFTLPEQPNANFELKEEIRLPINFSPFFITNVLDQGMAGVEIQLHKMGGNPKENSLAAYPLGGGYYEARELPDGVYTMTIHKDGYQEMTGNFSVNGGEQTPHQQFSLPHYVTVQGTIVNGKGMGVQGAEITLAGLNSQLLTPEEKIVTDSDGSFQFDLLVTGSESRDLREHIEVSWTDPASTPFLRLKPVQPISFGISHNFLLPTTPMTANLGLLHLPANFFPVTVQDIAGRGLSGVNVTFTDENAKEFSAKELVGGLYEGQNLPDGIYTVSVSKDGYETAQESGVRIISTGKQPSLFNGKPLSFQLPYYITVKGTTINGKGEELSSNVMVGLAGLHSHLLPDTVRFNQKGVFEATVLVTETGREQVDVTWEGEYGLHELHIPFMLPNTPQTVNLQRLNLPVNFIPIEVKDLLGYGVTGATVKLYHIESEQEIIAKELADGQYEGVNLPNGSYKISVAKEGYKPVEDYLATVKGGMVSDTKTFRLQHYVWITGIATNGEGEGIRDAVIELEHLRSIDTFKQANITGEFEAKLEVQEVGTERMYITWKNKYRSSITFNLPSTPEKKDLGEIRLPINFLTVLVTDISGSTLSDVEVEVKNTDQYIQTFKTDQNGSCKTYDLPNGLYHITVEKPGYKTETRDMQVRDGESVAVRFTLPHYMLVKGYVRDIMQNAVGGAEVIFKEFSDSDGQRLRTMTDAATGKFEQELLIDDPLFLERQKGHFVISKDGIEQELTFKIPTTPNQIINYKTLLFPTNYFQGKIVDAEVKTIPLDNAKIFLVPVEEQPLTTNNEQPPLEKDSAIQESLRLTTNSLGIFQVGELQKKEYKITIQKDGYRTYEDFIRISGLFQEQEFALQKE